MTPPIPHNREAEEAVIGAVLINPDSYYDLSQFLRAEDFYIVRHRWIWDAFTRLHEKQTSLDFLTVSNELGGQLDEIGGAAYLTSLLNQVPTSLHSEAYGRMVESEAMRRRMLTAANQIASLAYDQRETVDGFAVGIASEVAKIMPRSATARKHTFSMDIATVNALSASEAASRGEKGVETGLADLDNLLSPQKTDLIVIGARPGHGKSACLSGIAVHSARQGRVVKLFTAEMGATQVTQRIIASMAAVSAFRFMKGNLREDEWTKINEAVIELQGLPITICDLPEIKIGQIKSECRRDPVDVVLLDYIQLTNSDSKNDRRDLDIGEVTRGLKGLAKELDVPVFAAAQVGRSAEGREPNLADLRESGSIENDADSVVFIHRDPIKQSNAKFIVAKHRNGPVGFRDAYFDEETITFKSATPFGKPYPDYVK